jgi:hypothetical protein
MLECGWAVLCIVWRWCCSSSNLIRGYLDLMTRRVAACLSATMSFSARLGIPHYIMCRGTSTCDKTPVSTTWYALIGLKIYIAGS